MNEHGQTRGSAFARMRRFAGALLDQLYPPGCMACNGPVAGGAGLCAPCWGELTPITAPRCAVLGLPFAHDLGPESVSAHALANPPPFDRARSAVVYNDMARGLVSQFKYGDRPEFARFAGRMMVANCAELFGPDAVLVPIPLHYWRHFRRRYNQALELARVMGPLAKTALDADLLVRTRRTRQQVGLSARQRNENVGGAFAVRPDAAARHAGERIVLVDDVITTGATVSAASRVLKRAGFAHVDVVSFARVVIGADATL